MIPILSSRSYGEAAKAYTLSNSSDAKLRGCLSKYLAALKTSYQLRI
jgi:hypothetical protein